MRELSVARPRATTSVNGRLAGPAEPVDGLVRAAVSGVIDPASSTASSGCGQDVGVEPSHFSEYVGHAQHVVFGTRRTAEAIAAAVGTLSAKRALLVAGTTGRTLAARFATDLPIVGVFDQVQRHVPVRLAERARQAAVKADADVLLAVGGGSAIGTAKAIALTTGLPIIAVPTTYAGSEPSASSRPSRARSRCAATRSPPTAASSRVTSPPWIITCTTG